MATLQVVGTAINFNAGAPTTLTVACTKDMPAGGTLFIACGGNRPTTVAITDPRSNTPVADQNTAAVDNRQVSLHRIPITNGYTNGDSFTATWSAGSPDRAIALLYFDFAVTKDKTPAAANGTANAWASGTTGTLTNPLELAIAICGNNASTQVANTPTSPWIEDYDANTSDAFNFAVEHQLVSATSALNGQGTWATTTQLWRAIIGTYSYIELPRKNLPILQAVNRASTY